jgi:hypothetical protein
MAESNKSLRLANIIIFAPKEESRLANAKPIPLEPPEIRIFFLLKFILFPQCLQDEHDPPAQLTQPDCEVDRVFSLLCAKNVESNRFVFKELHLLQTIESSDLFAGRKESKLLSQSLHLYS